MATFVAKNSGAVKKKPVIILKEFIFFVLVSTSGTSDWQACEDSHWIKRTTFVFHKIAIYNSWTWKQSEDSLKISLTPGVQKLFLLWREIGDKIDHYISCVFLCEATKGASDWWNYRLTRKSNNIKKTRSRLSHMIKRESLTFFIKTILPWLSNI